MISMLGLGLMLSGELLPTPESMLVAGPYRARCQPCDEVGRDSRLPCNGHADNAHLQGKIVAAAIQKQRGT